MLRFSNGVTVKENARIRVLETLMRFGGLKPWRLLCGEKVDAYVSGGRAYVHHPEEPWDLAVDEYEIVYTL